MIILIGEGASGKTTILNELEKKGYQKAISYTTRKPRIEEEKLGEFKFISKEEFRILWEQNKLLQRAEFNDEYYGTDLESVEKDCVFISIVNAVKDIKERLEELNITDMKPVCFYISATPEERTKRLLKRGETIGYIQTRIAIDREKFEKVNEVADFVIENTNVDAAVNKIIELYEKYE